VTPLKGKPKPLIFGRNFRVASDGGLSFRMPDGESSHLRDLGTWFLRILDEEEDPRTRILFPTTYEEPDLEAAYVSGNRERLISGKRQNAAALIDAISEATRRKGLTVGSLDDKSAVAWLKSFNDMRLIVGSDIGIQGGEKPEFRSHDDPENAGWNNYALLTWCQDFLLHALEESRARTKHIESRDG